MIITCVNDQKPFEATRATARFCSEKCKKAWQRRSDGTRSVKLGKDVYVADGKNPVKKIAAEDKSLLDKVEQKTQATMLAKAERIKRLNERLAARGLPLLSEKLDPVTFIPTGIAALDALTSNADEAGVGGFPRKHITEVFGPKGSGKTSLMKLIADSTDQDLRVLYVDAENGLINPPAHIDISKSTTIEAVEGMVFEGVRTGDYDLIIVDSVAVLTSEKELEDAKAGMGGKAKAMAQFIRRVNAALRPIGPDGYPDPAPGTAVVFINQLRDTMNSFGIQEYTPGGRSIEYAASLRLELRSAKADRIVKNEIVIGQNVRVKVEKTRFGAPGFATKFKLMYGDLA